MGIEQSGGNRSQMGAFSTSRTIAITFLSCEIESGMSFFIDRIDLSSTTDQN
jgi:hypothetical protein